MNKINSTRDIQIYVCNAWGETANCLAKKHNISVKRIYSIIREQKHRAASKYPRCAVCGHSGGMHFTDEWEYNRGPCGEYGCECLAMISDE